MSLRCLTLVVLGALVWIGCPDPLVYSQETSSRLSEPVDATFVNPAQQFENIMARWGKIKQLNDKLRSKYERLEKERRALLEMKASLEGEVNSIAEMESRVPAGGPYRIYSHGDVVIEGKFNFLRDQGKTFSSYDDLMEFAKGLGGGVEEFARTFYVRDKEGKDCPFPPPRPDRSGVEDARRRYAQKKAEYDKRLADWEKESAEYEEEQKEVTEELDKIDKELQSFTDTSKMIVYLDTPLSPEQKKALLSQNPYWVEKIPAEVVKEGKVGDGECVALVRDSRVANLPPTKYWVRGPKVDENTPPGTPVAYGWEFKDGEYRYLSKPTGNHAAIYAGAYKKTIDKQGKTVAQMLITDQYNKKDKATGKIIGHKSVGTRVTSRAEEYYVIVVREP